VNPPPDPAARAGRRIPAALAVSLLDAALLALALGGPRALLRDPCALALIGVWTASSLTLALLRPPRTRDVARREAEPPLVLAALLLVPLAIPPVSAWTWRVGFGVLPGGTALRWGGVALAAFGVALRIAAMAQLGRRFSPQLVIQHQHALERRGLYARIRHPGYLGALIANLGAALAFRSLVGLGLVALLRGVVGARARREERLLAQQFGDEFEQYRAHTGAFLPRWGAAFDGAKRRAGPDAN
jgi:protein-S-isoprenylcysteine O-methyltransferase Ste14